MIADLGLRWVVTVLFVLSAAECIVAIIGVRRSWTAVVGNCLHLIMAVAMAVMAWPRGAELPTFAPMVFFLLAACWFVWAVVAMARHRAVNGYHVVMMLAMAWMYAAMNGAVLPGRSGPPHHGDMAHPASTAMGGDQMQMAGMDMAGMAPSSSPPADWITGVNWFWALGFAVAALAWTYRYFVVRQSRPSDGAHPYFGIACQAMMAVGMAVMFGTMV